MNNNNSLDNELWAYDEPHESGGNTRAVMTKSQAIKHLRDYLISRNVDSDDERVFADWKSLHWAYRVYESETVATPASSLSTFAASVFWYQQRMDGDDRNIFPVHLRIMIVVAETETIARDTVEEALAIGILKNSLAPDLPDMITYTMVNIETYLALCEKGDTSYADQPAKQINVRELLQERGQ